MTREELKIIITLKVESFVESLHGRFNEYLSDKFMIAYLVDKLIQEYKKNPLNLQSNLAYKVGFELFEILLEHGCDAILNGHHVAQDFASHFENEIF